MHLFGRDGIYLPEQQFDVALATVVEETLSEVQRKLLAVVGGYANLSFQLLLGSAQLLRAERRLKEAVQFASDQSLAAVYVVVVAAEVDAPRARVAIADEGALDGVDQSVALAQGNVQPCVHARSAQDVVEHIERHAPFVGKGERRAAHHDVRLMGVHMDGAGFTLTLPQGEGGWRVCAVGFWGFLR